MQRQRLMVFLVSLLMVLCVALPAEVALANPDVRVYFEDVQVEFEGASPYIESGRTMVPVGYVPKVLEAQVDCNRITERVTITKGDDELFFELGSHEAVVNGETVVLDVAPALVSGEVMVPLRLVSEGLGAWVEWWNADRSVRVYSSAPTASPMANLMNEGLVTSADGWVYYVMYDGVYRSRRDGSELKKIADTEASHLNKWGEWLVFSPNHYNTSSSKDYSGSPWIFRVPVDGGEAEEVAHVQARQVTVVDDHIYYRGTEYVTFQWNVSRMEVGGGDSELEVANVMSRFYIDGDWIYYTDKGIFRAKIDGTAVEQITDFLVYTYMIVSDDWIYCVRYDDGCLCRISTDGTEIQRLFTDYRCEGLNVADGWIYFATRAPKDQNPDDAIMPAIRRMRLDGSDVQVLATFGEDSQCWAICVDDGWVFFETWALSKIVESSPAYTLYRMNTDGSGLELLSQSE